MITTPKVIKTDLFRLWRYSVITCRSDSIVDSQCIGCGICLGTFRSFVWSQSTPLSLKWNWLFGFSNFWWYEDCFKIDIRDPLITHPLPFHDAFWQWIHFIYPQDAFTPFPIFRSSSVWTILPFQDQIELFKLLHPFSLTPYDPTLIKVCSSDGTSHD